MVTSTRDAQEDVVFFNDTATTEIYTLSLHDALPIFAQLWHPGRQQLWSPVLSPKGISDQPDAYSWTVPHRSEEHTSELQSRQYLVCRLLLEKKNLDPSSGSLEICATCTCPLLTSLLA